MIFGISNMLVIGGAVFVVVLLAVVGFFIYYNRGRMGRDPRKQLAKYMQKLKGDADALALLPYDDGQFAMKPANFDKELIGGQGGYETEDGDKIPLDGNGKAVKRWLGTTIVLGCDPTKHAGAVEMLKALMAYKNDIGEYIKVDRAGNVIEVGEALLPTPETEEELNIGPEGTIVDDKADEIAQDMGIRKELAMERALEELEKAGEVTKVVDLASPAAPAMTDGGEVVVEEATHIPIDLSKAADLMPTNFSTVELNTALDKARMEEHEPRALSRDMAMLAAGAIIAVFFGGMVVAINSFM